MPQSKIPLPLEHIPSSPPFSVLAWERRPGYRYWFAFLGACFGFNMWRRGCKGAWPVGREIFRFGKEQAELSVLDFGNNCNCGGMFTGSRLSALRSVTVVRTSGCNVYSFAVALELPCSATALWKLSKSLYHCELSPSPKAGGAVYGVLNVQT